MENEKRESDKGSRKLALFAIGAVVVAGAIYFLSKLKRKPESEYNFKNLHQLLDNETGVFCNF